MVTDGLFVTRVHNLNALIAVYSRSTLRRTQYRIQAARVVLSVLPTPFLTHFVPAVQVGYSYKVLVCSLIAICI